MAIFSKELLEQYESLNEGKISLGTIWQILKLVLLVMILISIPISNMATKQDSENARDKINKNPKYKKLLLDAVKKIQQLTKSRISSKYVKWEANIKELEDMDARTTQNKKGARFTYAIGSIDYIKMVTDVYGNEDWKNNNNARLSDDQMDQIRKLYQTDILDVLSNINDTFKEEPNGSIIGVGADYGIEIFNDGNLGDLLSDAPQYVYMQVDIHIKSVKDIEDTDEVAKLKEDVKNNNIKI